MTNPCVWALVALVLLTISRAAADDDADKRAEIRIRVAQLASSDPTVRTRAAKRIVELGPDALEAAARAAAAYLAWWDASKDRLAFDTTTGRWSTRK